MNEESMTDHSIHNGSSRWIGLAVALMATIPGGATAQTRLLAGWSAGTPSALGADASGPYWVRRTRDTVILERIKSGRVQTVQQAAAPIGFPGAYFEPQVVRGTSGAELFYRKGSQLIASNAQPITPGMGKAGWEFYGAARNGSNVFAAGFGIKGDGMSRVSLFPGKTAGTAMTSELRPYHIGVWAVIALLSPTRAFAVYRGYLIAPARGHGIIIEAMNTADLRASGRWTPLRKQSAPSQRGYYYGDPSAVLDPNGRPHFIATIWNDLDQPTGRFAINGIEAAERGAASYWLPQMTWVEGRGMVIAIQAQNGNVLVGFCDGRGLVSIAELPGRDFQLAAFKRNLYVSTSDGLWSFPTPASATSTAQIEPAMFGADSTDEESLANASRGFTPAGSPDVPAVDSNVLVVAALFLGLIAWLNIRAQAYRGTGRLEVRSLF